MRLVYYPNILKSAPLEPVYFSFFFFNYLTPPPSTRGVSNDTRSNEGNENNSSGLPPPNRDNSNDNKNKKTKHSHSTIDSSYFSQFPSYVRLDLGRRSCSLYSSSLV